MENLIFSTQLGVSIEEKKIGQNIHLSLSIQIPYENTFDQLSNTLDYGEIYSFLSKKISQLNEAHLLEYFVEQILMDLKINFQKIQRAKIKVTKEFVPIKNFQGKIRIEAEKSFLSNNFLNLDK